MHPSASPQSHSRAPVAGEFEVEFELESQLPPPIPEDDDETLVGHNPELEALIAAQDVGRLRIAPELQSGKKDAPASRRDGVGRAAEGSRKAGEEQLPPGLVSLNLSGDDDE